VSRDNQVNQMPFTTAEIAKLIGGEVVGDGKAVAEKLRARRKRATGDLTFAENEDYFARAEQSAATAIIADKRFSSSKKILIQVPNARVAFAKALALFFPRTKIRRRNSSDGRHCPIGRKLIPARTSGRIASSASA
jgi:UDP-3-O-[3-hydroxymyristoyl] glucosamine N-acyltransferase